MVAKAEARMQRLQNALRSVVLLGSMAALVGALGYVIFGLPGLIVTAGATTATLLLAGRVPVGATLRMLRARPLPPQAAPEVHRIVEALAQRAQLPTPRLAWIPAPQPNALALGHPDRSVIAVTNGLLARMNERELTGILAHEMSHLQNRDLPVMMLARQAAGFARFLGRFGLILLVLNLPLTAVGAQVSWLAVLLMLVAPWVVTALSLALSRTREYDADLGAVHLTGDPAGLASALQKLEHATRSFLGQLFGFGSRTSWWMTHPATSDRVRRLAQLAA